MILLTSANWLHVEWANRDGDFRKLASAVERQARGTELRVFGGRFYALDFYVARPVLQLRTPEEFNDFVLEARHPVVLIDAPRGWVFVQKTAPSAVRVLDRIFTRLRQCDDVRWARKDQIAQRILDRPDTAPWVERDPAPVSGLPGRSS